MRSQLLAVLLFLGVSGVSGASEIDGVWNLLFDPGTHPHQNNLVLKVNGTEVTGRMWADDVHGTYENGKLSLEFPYSTPYLPGKRGMARFDGKYQDGVLSGTYDVVGWQGPFRATKMKLAPPGGAYPPDGLWNALVTVYGGPHSIGTTTAMMLSLKVIGTEVTGWMWEDEVHGTFIDGKIQLEFPWTDPYFGVSGIFRMTANYEVYDDAIFGTASWGEDTFTVSATRVPAHIVPVESVPVVVVKADPESASELDGVWNLLYDPEGHAHMNNLVLKVADGVVTGQMWEDRVHGTYEDGKLHLRFPFTSPYLVGFRGMAEFHGVYQDGKLTGTYEVGHWQGRFEAWKAVLGERGGASPLDGLWNCLATVYTAPSANGATFPLLFSIKVKGEEITGRLWEDDISGKFVGNRITLDFPYADPFFPGRVENMKLKAAYNAYDDLISGTWAWGEYTYTIIGSRVPVTDW